MTDVFSDSLVTGKQNTGPVAVATEAEEENRVDELRPLLFG